ncbi:MAG: ATP synthase d subunit [Chaenotheca gracillima]|nr:MAG: ATP synthase d subunit [Chaenotheca gracillima]
MPSSRNMTQNDKNQLIQSLRTHRVNTLTELRRIERVFAHYDQAEVCEPMTNAWAHYVNSNNLLNELRGLTKNYPFSSECLDEAKWKVIEDPASQRSWNYCWLVLSKIRDEQLIVQHAQMMAQRPEMWGNRTPTAAGVSQLAGACINEWTWALNQMLRHWEGGSSSSGY